MDDVEENEGHAQEAGPEAAAQVTEQSAEHVQEPGPEVAQQVTGDSHPVLALVDALEKALETELPAVTMLMVQTACADIRKHLAVTAAA